MGNYSAPEGSLGRGLPLRVDLAGTVIEIRTPDGAWADRLEERFGRFRTRAAVNLEVLHRPGSPGPPVEGDRRFGPVILNGAATADHLDALLTTLLPERLAPSLLFHGTLLSDGSCSYLACGVSGSGKSTLAALLPERALCDELAVVRTAADGFDGVSLPYWVSRPGSAPLAAVFVLEHARIHRRIGLSPGAAMQELRRHVCWPTEDPAALAAAFATLAELAGSVPVYRLGFRRDPGVWDLITEPTP